ncbi:hypothetical protein B0J14DRAFT_482779 [Halenospora varia]|nr:hypothetical protein B0J14DRAFT_482779 [Halenospora varia]
MIYNTLFCKVSSLLIHQQVLTWTFTAAAILLTVTRYTIRLRTLHQSLQISDWIHGFGLLALIAYMITYTIMFPYTYSMKSYIAGHIPEPVESYMTRYIHLQITISFMFWVVIYSIKFSFLFFYRNIFGSSRIFMRAWWVVFAFTALTFGVCFVSIFWACGEPKGLFSLELCFNPESAVITRNLSKIWCSLHVVSNLAVILLPTLSLTSLRISPRQKAGLAFIFTLGFADTIFDIVRTVYTTRGGDSALDPTWDILEPSIAVIASSLPTCRALFLVGRWHGEGEEVRMGGGEDGEGSVSLGTIERMERGRNNLSKSVSYGMGAKAELDTSGRGRRRVRRVF